MPHEKLAPPDSATARWLSSSPLAKVSDEFMLSISCAVKAPLELSRIGRVSFLLGAVSSKSWKSSRSDWAARRASKKGETREESALGLGVEREGFLAALGKEGEHSAAWSQAVAGAAARLAHLGSTGAEPAVSAKSALALVETEGSGLSKTFGGAQEIMDAWGKAAARVKAERALARSVRSVDRDGLRGCPHRRAQAFRGAARRRRSRRGGFGPRDARGRGGRSPRPRGRAPFARVARPGPGEPQML